MFLRLEKKIKEALWEGQFGFRRGWWTGGAIGIGTSPEKWKCAEETSRRKGIRTGKAVF